MNKIILIFTSLLLLSCNGTAQKKATDEIASAEKKYEVTKTDAEWKALLPANAYYVLRKAGTERPFTSKLNKNYDDGTYVCAGCQTPLYKSEHKFDSGTGWPSFDRAIEENIEFDVDYKIGYARTELKCNTCGGHLGHMFEDGPRETTGERHCINGVALNFIPATDGNQ